VDLVSLVTPSYFKKSLTDEALIRYYTEVAEAMSIPVFVYNAPGFTGLTVSAGVIETLSQHPNIGGMKDTSPAGLAGYLEVCADDFDVLAGSMNTLFIGLSLGASGGVISLANAFPEPCCALYKAFTDGDVATARQVHSRLFRLNKAVSGASGVAGVKYAMELGGYHGGNPRLPLLPIKDADKQRIQNAAEEAGVL
jgi:4-hydroxy-2-oxoglutarate aldolase